MFLAVTASIVSASVIGAASAVGAQARHSGGLASAMAVKFHLNQDDVQKVINENRAGHMADRRQRMEERLDQAVVDDEITSAQKDEIATKLKEMKTFMESLKGKSVSKRQAARKAKHTELKQWAKDNGVPVRFLLPRELGNGARAHQP